MILKYNKSETTILSMEKEKLIRNLMTASELEETHAQIVLTYFLNNFDWSNIEDEKVNRVKGIIKIIRHQTSNHEMILNGLIGYVKSSDLDEF